MRLIKKGHEPISLRNYKVKIAASFKEMDKEVRKELEEVLINEQFGVCAYCQQKLKNFTIEHHCEQKICNGENGTIDRTMDYKNLFAVCSGESGKFRHCDTSKSDFNSGNGLPIEINLLKANHVDKIKYHSTGLMSTPNTKHLDEINRILNLNCDFLKEKRRTLWIKIYKNSNNGKNIKKMNKIIEDELNLVDRKFKNSFPGLSEFMQKKFCS